MTTFRVLENVLNRLDGNTYFTTFNTQIYMSLVFDDSFAKREIFIENVCSTFYFHVTS